MVHGYTPNYSCRLTVPLPCPATPLPIACNMHATSARRTFSLRTPRETVWLQGFNETDAAIWVQRLQLAVRSAAEHAGKPLADVGRQLFSGGLGGAPPPPTKPLRRKSGSDSLNEDDVGEAVFQGVLLTRKTVATLGWKRRFAVLVGSELRIYRNDKSGALKTTLHAPHLTIQPVGVRHAGAASNVTRGAPAESRFRIFDGHSGFATDWAAEDEKARFILMNGLYRAGATAVPTTADASATL